MRILKTIKAEAHCDIPCGIYDPTPAKIFAKTVQRMVEQLEEIKPPEDMDDVYALNVYHNSVMRRIAVKEEHAEKCKRELQILWSDFFKPEHLKDFPNLHNIFWKTLKLCSKNKQEVNKDSAVELVRGVDEIAEIFYKAKKAPDKFEAYRKLTDTLY